jgi:hypothetical protein
MKKIKFSKDFIPKRPTQDKNPYTRKPRIKRISWRHRDSSQAFIEEIKVLQKNVDTTEDTDETQE